MIVLAQRWSDGTPSEKFGRWAVEALVIIPHGTAGYGSLQSAFYDQGQTVAQPFKLWERGCTGAVPQLIRAALPILSGWALPEHEITSLSDYASRIDASIQQLTAVLTAQGAP